MTSENILVSIVAIIASFAALVVVALAIDYPKRIWHHLTGGTYKPVEQVASAYLLPTGVAAAGGMILVLGIVALVQPFDLYDVSPGRSHRRNSIPHGHAHAGVRSAPRRRIRGEWGHVPE